MTMIRRAKILCVLMVFVFVVPAWARGLTILFTNDIHGHLGTEKTGGFARLCTEVRKQRKLAESRGDDSIFVVPGDIFQGTLISGFSRGGAEFAALRACGVDAIAIGNHDFDYGLKRILELSKKAGFPVLCANCRYRRGKKLVFKPSDVIEKHGKKLFLLGLVTPNTPRITAGQKDMKYLVFGRPGRVLKRYAKKKNLIILSHLGVFADRKLAGSTKAKAVIIGGHTHTVLKTCEMVNNIPICQAGAYARYLGVMHLDYENGRLKYMDSRLIPVKGLPADTGVMAVLKPWLDKVKKMSGKRIGRSAINFSANGAAMHSRETLLGDLVCDAMLEKAGADAGFVNAGGIRWGLNKGIVTFGDIYRVLPFDNRVFILKIQGKALKKILRHIIRQRGRSGFMQICGMEVVVSRGRIRKLTIHGQPWYWDKVYRIATIDFLIKGGDGYGFLRRYQPKKTGILLRDTLVDFARTHQPLTFPPQGRWNFDTGL